MKPWKPRQHWVSRHNGVQVTRNFTRRSLPRPCSVPQITLCGWSPLFGFCRTADTSCSSPTLAVERRGGVFIGEQLAPAGSRVRRPWVPLGLVSERDRKQHSDRGHDL